MIFIMMMLLSCENDIKVINSLSGVDSLPLEIAYDVEIQFSDSGRLQAVLMAPVMERVNDVDEYLEFSEGFKAVFYDSVANPESEITAKYGINYEKKDLMEARHNVVIKNFAKQEQLNTEHLIWDRKGKKIFSDVFITLTKPEEVLYGDGFTSDENFETYEVINPSGEFNVEQDNADKK
jgi:LPS export ABC transporter protein LptC